MKDIREDFLKALPEWAQDHVNKNHKSVHGFFKDVLNIVFEDGSHVTFMDAGWFFGPDKKSIAVLTEHCGYHVFPWYGKVGSIDGLVGHVRSSGTVFRSRDGDGLVFGAEAEVDGAHVRGGTYIPCDRKRSRL